MDYSKIFPTLSDCHRLQKNGFPVKLPTLYDLIQECAKFVSKVDNYALFKAFYEAIISPNCVEELVNFYIKYNEKNKGT